MRDSFHILYWRDIPSMVKGKMGRKRLSHPLDNRFMEAIDAAAMRTGDTESDEYLEAWRSSDPIPFGDQPEQQLAEVAAQLEADYPRERLLELMRNGGIENGAA